jgi:hypothetical protein
MRSEIVASLSVLLMAAAGCGTDERILTDNVVDPLNVAKITRFRSCCGHDYSGGGESDRSMKHYLYAKPEFVGSDSSLPVLSPCDGEIVSMEREQTVASGYQIRIVPRARPDVHVVLFHVNPSRGPGAVRSGERIGHADLRTGLAFDVTMESLGALHPYFDWLDDDAFAPWQARGLASRESAVVSREQRDADPCRDFEGMQCAADTITFPP